MAIKYLVIYDQSLPPEIEAQVVSICSPISFTSTSRKALGAITNLFDQIHQSRASAYWFRDRASLNKLIDSDIQPKYVGQIDTSDLPIFKKLDDAYFRMEMLMDEARNLDNHLAEHLQDVAQLYNLKNNHLPTANPYYLGNDFYDSMDIMKETIEEIFDSYRIYGRKLRDD
jgi:hypothetical protein